ncbi:MAG: type I-MYXAN CRISPR-associated Cas8a1/Cmx1, partial [Candidatus Riflebacteria bacterium]|nr:type I-MYXAN CRISPR-associated Cas8a1/Cmx1 [Candidatus Riflebacteria bacterium]
IGAHFVTLAWKNSQEDFFQRLLEKSFTVDSNGMISFAAHHNLPMGDLKRYLLHDAILKTFLQHGQTREMEKSTRSISFQFDDRTVNIAKFKSVRTYNSQNAAPLFSKGNLSDNVEVKGWLYPGAVERHVALKPSLLTTSGKSFLLLLFAPAGCLYFHLRCKSADGTYDKRKGAAVVVPHYTELTGLGERFDRYLEAPIERLYAASLADAALSALYQMRLQHAGGMLESIGVNSCSVFTMGTIPWAKQQKTRTGAVRLDNVPVSWLDQFGLCLQSLGNTLHFKDDSSFWGSACQARGLFAGNIAADRDWFVGFADLMKTQKMAKNISWERKGLNDMVEQAAWNQESDRLFVEAVHAALRSMYGQLAQRARDHGEEPRFDREFERLRSALMRAKNRQTVRAELADLFARGKLNKSLQKHWTKLLPLFTGPDWQRAKDLTLLGMASYQGSGAAEIIDSQGEEELEEETE